jgi:hypothetical protein
VGIAQWNGAETGAALLDRAADALHRAKAAGRNGVQFAPTPAMSPDEASARAPWLRVVKRYDDVPDQEAG